MIIKVKIKYKNQEYIKTHTLDYTIKSDKIDSFFRSSFMLDLVSMSVFDAIGYNTVIFHNNNIGYTVIKLDDVRVIVVIDNLYKKLYTKNIQIDIGKFIYTN